MMGRDVPSYGAQIASKYAWFFLSITAAYVPCIFLGQWYMKKRPPHKLKWAAFVWNISLSFISGLGALTILFTIPDYLTKIIIPFKDMPKSAQLSISLFLLTKWIEFGDTVFLVLKKKKLAFLHIYHHLTVSLYTWHAQLIDVYYVHQLAFINLGVHWIMYFYYAWTSVAPRHWLMSACRSYITMIQTLQMFIGVAIASHVLSTQVAAGPLLYNTYGGLIMYISYAYLFVLFYLQNYMTRVRSTMALVIGTSYIGAILGALRAWKNPSFWFILLEVMFGFAFTLIVLRNFCLPPENFKGLGTSYHSNKISALNSLNNSTMITSTEESTVVQRRAPLKKDQSIVSDLSPTSTTSTQPSVLNEAFTSPVSKQAHEDAFNPKVTTDATTDDELFVQAIQYLINKKALAPYLLQLRKRSLLSRILLVVQNPWMTWALEYQYLERMSTTLENFSESSLMEQLLIQSDIPLKMQQAFTLLNHQLGLYFSHGTLDMVLIALSFSLAAYTGYLLHHDWILGVLVHGCLRWVLELHLTGTLLTKEMIIPKFESAPCTSGAHL